MSTVSSSSRGCGTSFPSKTSSLPALNSPNFIRIGKNSQSDRLSSHRLSLVHENRKSRGTTVRMALVDERQSTGQNVAHPPPRILAYDLVQGDLVKWRWKEDKSVPDTPTAVLLHGILGSGKNWGTFARRLAHEFPTWQFLLVDLRCHGDSASLKKRGPHSVASTASDVLKLVGQLRLTPRVLVGHSFGGKVVLSMVEQAAKPLPRPVRAWVLDATPGKVRAGGDGEDHPRELISFLRQLPKVVSSKNEVYTALMEEGFSNDVAQWVVTNLRSTGPSSSSFSWAFDLDGIAELYQSYEDTNLWNFVENLPRGVHVNFLKAERSLHRWALEDLQRIHAAEELASEEGGGVEMHVLEDAGHWVHTDNPDGLFRILSSSFQQRQCLISSFEDRIRVLKHTDSFGLTQLDLGAEAMAQSNWEADKMLDVYIYDYLVKKKLHNTAKSFMTEGKVSPDPVAIDAPGGFLFEWWSVFWDIFIARTNEKHSESAAAYIEAQQGKAKEQQMQLQQLQMMRQAQMQRREPSLGGPMNAIVSDGMVGQSNNASAMAAKMYEERMKQPNPMNAETSQPHMDPRMALLKSGTSHHGQMVQGNHQGGVSAALQQLQSRTQQTPEIKSEVNLGASPRQLPVDPSTVYGQGILQSKPGMGSAGLNPGVGALPLKGWPLTGIDSMRQGLGPQVQKAFLQNQGQFQLSPQQQQQQQIMAQVQGQGNMTNSSMYGDMDSRRFTGLPRGNLNSKDGQQNANDGSIGSPMLSNSSKLINMPQAQQSSSQQQDPLLSQQSQQNNRKRKGPSSSGPANSTGTGNTVGPSNSQPSTPSTHTPVEGVAMTGNMQHVNNMPKGPMMYGSDAIGGLASSANQLEYMEPFGDVGALEDNVESFLSQDDGDGGSLFGTLKRNPSEHTETSKVFSFNEVGSIRRSASKVICCNFSSDGKLLASAGHDKKVFIWNMETLHTEIPPEEHGHIITDVRFQPNSTQLATSSFDKTIKIWDVSKPGYFVRTISGHNAPVMSLDFHPKKTDLFCSCDTNNEIRFWSINAANCLRGIKGASTQVRFQPKVGQMLAAASENIVSIFDVEQYRGVHSFKGHSSSVHSICWNPTGDLVASVSEDSVKVWSVGSGECIHELSSSGNKFHSCVYHPTYPNLLVIGGYQSLELWDTGENKCMTIAAHECVISALAQSSSTGMMASASHDKSVKIWK